MTEEQIENLELSPPEIINKCTKGNRNICENRIFWYEKLRRDFPEALNFDIMDDKIKKGGGKEENYPQSKSIYVEEFFKHYQTGQWKTSVQPSKSKIDKEKYRKYGWPKKTIDALSLEPYDLVEYCHDPRNSIVCDNWDFWFEKIKIDYPEELYPYEPFLGERIKNMKTTTKHMKSIYLQKFYFNAMHIENIIGYIINTYLGGKQKYSQNPVYKRNLFKKITELQEKYPDITDREKIGKYLEYLSDFLPEKDREQERYNNGLVKINGPMGAKWTEYEGKKYIFLDNFHTNYGEKENPDKGRICVKCGKYKYKKCYDLRNLLSLIFTNAEKQNKGVEIYLETPFRKTDKEMFWNVSEKNDGIYEIENYFSKCFVKKTECKYKNVLFQHADIRKWIDDYKGYWGVGKFMYGRGGFEKYILGKMQQMVENVKNYDINLYEIENLRTTIADIFFGNHPISYKLLEIYLKSDDVVNDVLKLFRNIDIENIEKFYPPDHLIVKKNGKIFHKIRKQLIGLENEGQKELADKIVKYILGKYEERLREIIIPKLEDIITSINIIISDIKNVTKYNLGEYFEKLEQEIDKLTSNMVSSNQSIIMDAYTLPRLFRKFKIPGTEIETTKKIVYAGDYHNDNYANFFKEVLGTKVKRIGDNNKYAEQCITVSYDDYLWMLD